MGGPRQSERRRRVGVAEPLIGGLLFVGQALGLRGALSPSLGGLRGDRGPGLVPVALVMPPFPVFALLLRSKLPEFPVRTAGLDNPLIVVPVLGWPPHVIVVVIVIRIVYPVAVA